MKREILHKRCHYCLSVRVYSEKVMDEVCTYLVHMEGLLNESLSFIPKGEDAVVLVRRVGGLRKRINV